MKGKLFVVSGPSGAGKGTICRELLKRRPEICLSVSCATRAPRPGEIDGVHYFFLSKEEFLARKEAGGLLECAQFNGGNWYGTPRDHVLTQLEAGKSVLLEIENNGAQQVIRQYPETVSVFILPPDLKTLLTRLIMRGTEDLEKLRARLEKMPSEFKAAKAYTCLIINDEMERATERLEAVFDGDLRTGEKEKRCLEEANRRFADMAACRQLLDDCYRQVRGDFVPA